MDLKAKFFDELTTDELYEILRSRSEIFVVEQNCVYQDMDDRDRISLHVFFTENGRTAAYLRAYNTDSRTVQMGRVLTLRHGTGLGGRLLTEGIRLIREKLDPEKICIDAQCYAAGFYERAGFRICSEEFIEDGIPHVRMALELPGREQRDGHDGKTT